MTDTERQELACRAIHDIANALRSRLPQSGGEGAPTENLKAGIALCEDMVRRLQESGLGVTEKTLFAPFRRYAVDSMPWDPELWQAIERAQKEVRACLRH